ncbi:MAG TPA: hypothetical protein VI072_21150 [Polyangiaceae bacterium]
MHRRIRLGTGIGAFIFGASLAVSHDARADAAVTVQASTIRQTLSPTFHGINYVGFWDPAQGSTASSTALSKTNIKMIRFPGGDPGDWYDWQCPYYTTEQTPSCPATPVSSSWSSTSPLDLWQYASRFGGSVLFQTNFAGNVPNPPGQSYAVNSPQNAAAWARYAQAQGMRASFEIGNEQDIHMTSEHDPNFQPYIQAFSAQASAIHAVDPNFKVFGPAGTNEWFWWALDSLGMFLAGAGNKTGTGQVDGVSLHFYSGTDWESSVERAQYWESSNGPWNFIKSTIANHDTRSLPVYISEWHIGSPYAAFNSSMANALVTADMIGAFADSGVAGQQYFTIHNVDTDPNSWGLLHSSGESRPTDSPTPNYYAMVLWGRMGDRVLNLTQSADPARGVSHYAAKKADGAVQVLSINKSNAAETVTTSFTGFNPTGRNVSMYTLTPVGDRTSRDVRYNGVTNPSPSALPAAATQSVSGASFSHVLAANSISLLDFAPGASGTGGTGGSAGTGGGGTAGTPTCSTHLASSASVHSWGLLAVAALALSRLLRRRRANV